ncbi:MAG: hypothetical protein C0604_03405 [Clostridiales bacterium]|nr:MAG: hypothetical protein C0604_03405 [Clostridiales bacterium]
MKNKTNKKVLSVVFAASMLLAMGVTAFATETTETGTNENARGYNRQASEMRGRTGTERGAMKAPGVRLAIGDRLLDEMVENGTIEESDVEAIESFLEEQRELAPEERAHPEEGEGPLEFLAGEGVISQETADDIKAGLESLREEKREEFEQSIIDEGILEDYEIEEVLEFMDDYRQEREEMRDELSEMTREERREYMEENREDFQGPLEEMVEEGLISDDQADAIRDLMPRNGQRDFRDGRNNFNPNMDRGTKNGVPFESRTCDRFTPLMDAEEL